MKTFEIVSEFPFKEVYLYTHALAEDITADTFAKTFATLPAFRGDCNIRT